MLHNIGYYIFSVIESTVLLAMFHIDKANSYVFRSINNWQSENSMHGLREILDMNKKTLRT